ncbi:uncharacterized protein LOC111343954 [Stylophora pistillata]|uniref:uncharacterized protein LOC111343954 n=1 Tax=Stylophora pistillata TaxID=50429 RepID=UPI000C04335E|nr:uncharacterized protein LOC111343954 [Stylophora pistillata]
MEASSRPSQEPRHQCHFLHKTFQEFLAAFYLANELLTNQPNLTLGKKDVWGKYRQVIFFVAGILGMEGTVFFKQIGTILRGDWDWHNPNEDCEFLLDLLEESGAADHFGKVVCPLIPLPTDFQVGKKERSCLRLIRYAYEGAMLEGDSTPVQLTTLSLCNVQSFKRDDVHNFHRILEDSQTLTELVIYKIENMSHDIADLFAESVSSSTSLRKVTLKLLDVSTERCTYNASALLSTFSQLNCVALEFFCILNNTVAEAVKVLLKTSLRSLALIVYGDLDDCLASSVSEGLAEETGLESLSLVVHGKPSNPGIVALQKGVLRNRTLHSLELQVYGEIPEAWMTAVATLLAANKSWKSLIIHPNVCGKIKCGESLPLHPILGAHDASLEKSLTVNVCGELSVDSLKALGSFFTKSSPLSGLHLNVQGKLSNDVVKCLVDYFLANNLLFSHSIINLCGEITIYGENALQRLVKEGQKHSISVHVNGPSQDNILGGLETSADFSSVSASFLVDGTTTAPEVINLLSFASLRTFHLTVNNHADESEGWALGVANGLASSSSLTSFTLIVNIDADEMGNWAMAVGDGLANSSSLTTFSLTVNNHADSMGNWAVGVRDGLANSSSLTTFSLTVNNYADGMGYWAGGVGDGLANSSSLTTFSLTVNNYADDMGYWAVGVVDGLANSSSLTTFSLTVNNHVDGMGYLAREVVDGLAKSSSLTTFSLTVNNHADGMGYLAGGVVDGLANSRSLTTFSLTVNNHADSMGNWASGVGNGLAKSSSLTTFSLTVNNHVDSMGNWASGVGNGLAKSSSLTTLSLTVINHRGELGRWANNLSKGLTKNHFLTTIRVAFNLCGEKRIR